jgi:hypothetical protein
MIKRGWRPVDTPAVLRAARRFSLLAIVLLFAVPASARQPSEKKAIWGPVAVDGVSQFPIYAQLGVGIYQATLPWSAISPTRPRDLADPSDPAYRWPADIDVARDEARRYGMRVALMITGAPPWANGGRPSQWAPSPESFAAFAQAAARRYPDVGLWLIWSEPTKATNFQPLAAGDPRGPRTYARLLDAAYGALKAVRPGNRVIGGNSFTGGVIRPEQFVRWLRLPDGRPPRMDMYGHNPFGAREPDLRRPPLGGGYADFCDLDTLMSWVDANLGRAGGRRLPLFLSEYTVPTDQANWEFNFHVTPATQARWLASALRIVRRTPRLYTLGWAGLYDDPADALLHPAGTEVHRGLLDVAGRPKPSFWAFARG